MKPAVGIWSPILFICSYDPRVVCQLCNLTLSLFVDNALFGPLDSSLHKDQICTTNENGILRGEF